MMTLSDMAAQDNTVDSPPVSVPAPLGIIADGWPRYSSGSAYQKLRKEIRTRVIQKHACDLAKAGPLLGWKVRWRIWREFRAELRAASPSEHCLWNTSRR